MFMFLALNIASSQTKLKVGTLTHLGNEYRIGQIKQNEDFIFSVRNRPKIPSNPEMVHNNKMPWEGVVSRLTNADELLQVVLSTLPPDRLVEIKEHIENLDITMFSDRDGNLIYFYFALSSNTVFTAQELAKIYFAIKSDFSASITSRLDLHRELNNIFLHYIVDFSTSSIKERR